MLNIGKTVLSGVDKAAHTTVSGTETVANAGLNVLDSVTNTMPGNPTTTGGATPDPEAPSGPLDTPLVAKEETVVTIVHFTNGNTKDDREGFYLKLLKSSLDDEVLSDLRANIAGLTGSIEVAHLPFCTKSGAVVPETFTIQEYFKEGLELDTTNAKVLHVYMKTDNPTSPERTDEPTLRSETFGGSTALARLKREVDETTFKWVTGTQAKYTPELEEKDWAMVCDSNSLCYGLRIVRRPDAAGVVQTVGVEQARYPAFRFKKRNIVSDSLATSTLKDVKMNLRIPEFFIDDKSYVTIYKTTSSAQLSMASSSFSKFDVEASGGASYFGVSVSASASYGQSSSSSSSADTSSTKTNVTIAYNFPRVTVFLDERSLELTPECEKAIRKITDGPSLTTFLDDYGEFFSRRVQLGGRLFSTEEVDTSTGASASATEKSMKAAASVSFSGWGAHASVSASGSSGSTASNSSSTSSSTSSLTWQANGGDTLLANLPKDWAPTVAYYWNWRITQQDSVLQLVDILAKFPGQEGLPAKVKAYKPDTPLGISPRRHKRFTINLDGIADGRYLVATPPNIMNLDQIKNVYNSVLESVVYQSEASYYNRGGVFMGPKVGKRIPIDRAWEAEDKDSNAVVELHYGTPYYVKHVSSGLWLDFKDTQWYRLMFGNSSKSRGTQVQFVNPANAADTGVIAASGKAKIDFLWGTWKPHVVVAVEDDENAYPAVSRGGIPYTPAVFNIKY